MKPDRLARLPQVLFEIGKAIGSESDLPSLLANISELVCELVDADACSVALLDPERNCLLTKAAFGLGHDRIEEISFRPGEGVAGWVVKNKQPALLGDVTEDPRFVVFPNTPTPIRSMACVPLMARDEPVGSLTATAAREDAFGESDVDLLSFVARTIALDVENARLRKTSVTDPLTGAYNREFLQHRLPAELAHARQHGRPLSVAMIDVDHFKAVNDRYGHEIGDRVLEEVASRLRGAIRRHDLLVRYGGEEFLVVLPDADLHRAREVGERMRQNLQGSAIRIEDERDIEVRISVGVTEQVEEDDATTLIRRADTALYTAKGRGRNRVEVAQ
jgi:diguanylate cyclase (GGDEF)-like protein